MPDHSWSLLENGMPGLHLTINPQKPLPAEARINRQFVDHNLTLSTTELQSLMAGRSQGIATINTLLGRTLPGFRPDTRLRFATQIADALLDKSLGAQLSRDAPNTFDRLQQRDDQLRHMFQQAAPDGATRGNAPSLLQRVPVGVSLTVHF